MKAKSGEAAKAKEEAAKEMMVQKVTKLKAAEGVYSLALASVMDQDKRLAEPLINLIEEQLLYHQQAVRAIRSAPVSVSVILCRRYLCLHQLITPSL